MTWARGLALAKDRAALLLRGMRADLRTVSLVGLAMVWACAPPNKAKPYPAMPPAAGTPGPVTPTAADSLRYFARTINLEPFLTGFPYEQWMPSLRSQRLFFVATGDRYSLKMLDLTGVTGPFDLTKATTISSEDWSTRSLWDVHHHVPSASLWLHADARNDEKMNLWRLELASGALAQVTDHDYVYGFGFSADDRQVAYLPRSGTAPPYTTCLRVMDTASQAAREVVCDSPSLQFTWSQIRWSPDASEVYFQAQIDGDRNRIQLVAVDLTAAKPTVRALTDAKVSRTDADALEGWVDDSLLFLANDDGYRNLYSVNRKTRLVRQLTRYTEDIRSAHLIDAGVFAAYGSPLGSTLALIDARTGKALGEQRKPGTVDVIAGHGARALWTQEAPDLVFEANMATVASDGQGLQTTPVITLPADLAAQVVQCRAEAIKIPTFDRDRTTGRPRELHAFVLRPRQPVAPAEASQRLALIRAFYGGDNRYSTFDHIMCAAGLTVVSPAVRGSSGFGKAFQGLNDRDLGGDEIIDLFYVARWIERKLGLVPRQIGVYGGSHGGYATMRALTFPPSTNGRGEAYNFGFGLSHAGFSDIKSFHDSSNIPDWVVLESGDPKNPDDLARMTDRSPRTHVDKLQAPLLLTHGANDWRVPVSESRAFYERAKALGKPVTYVEFADQGHHIEGLARIRQLYQARFDFLMKVAQGPEKPTP